ncbi:hypothetical protein BZA70DRAFT_165013 [Myxozyma melibiosi]|uniref:Uncharacterized protein n=1 Tax=Myxozyma melibiosi TaxID=54550 RepID=A0ABR1F718_9ASCO
MEFSPKYTENIRTLDLTSLQDVFDEVQRDYLEKSKAGQITGPCYHSLKSFLFGISSSDITHTYIFLILTDVVQDRKVPFTDCCPNTEHLIIAGEVMDSQATMLTCLRSLCRLKHLECRSASVALGSFSGIAARANCPKLNRLTINCSGAVCHENVHIANFLKYLRPSSLSHISITGICQTDSLQKIFDGISHHACSLKSLELSGVSQRIVGLLPSIGLCPILQDLIVTTCSSSTLSSERQDKFMNWLAYYMPAVENIKLQCCDAEYLTHKLLACASNSVHTLELGITRQKAAPGYYHDLFFRALATSAELKEVSIVDYSTPWIKSTIARFCDAIAYLDGLKKLNIDVMGLSESDCIAILPQLPSLEDLSARSSFSDNILRAASRHAYLQRLSSTAYPSCISADSLQHLFAVRDQDDALPITICFEAGTRVVRQAADSLYTSQTTDSCTYWDKGPSSAVVALSEHSPDYAPELWFNRRTTTSSYPDRAPSLDSVTSSDSDDSERWAMPLSPLALQPAVFGSGGGKAGGMVFVNDVDSEDEAAEGGFEYDMIA